MTEIHWLELGCNHINLQEDGMTPSFTTCRKCKKLVRVTKAGYVSKDGRYVYFLPGSIGVTEYQC